MKQLIAEKFDESKVKVNDDIATIILNQYGLKAGDGPFNVSDLYMPEEEQDKMQDWMIENSKEFRAIKSKIMRENQMSYVRLDIFPSSVKK